MRAVVIGGTGSAGKQVVDALRQRGAEVTVASPSQGINALTGEGMEEAFKGVEVVVDASNPPRSEYGAVMQYFETVTANALKYGTSLQHYVVISIITCDKQTAYPYMRAKVRQEELVASNGKVAYTIARCAQFYEFAATMAAVCDYRLAPVLFQPIATIDVGPLIAKVALGKPANATVEIAGPERVRVDQFIQAEIRRLGDTREIITDPNAEFFGAPVEMETLLPELPNCTYGTTTYKEWVQSQSV